ncbi:YraN family protein [Candidatus Kaiserbacteria bacterium]|nr:YraN family protein [Candidatus Kaiserbacteria bacterium]
MPNTRDQHRKEIGRIGEDIAAKFLERKGFKILARNYRKPWGEIDIIAEKGGVVRFVEVKSVTRENISYVTHERSDYRPEEQIHPLKLRKIARTAEIYMNEREDAREYQIDAVGVFLSVKERKARCRLFEQVL